MSFLVCRVVFVFLIKFAYLSKIDGYPRVQKRELAIFQLIFGFGSLRYLHAWAMAQGFTSINSKSKFLTERPL